MNSVTRNDLVSDQDAFAGLYQEFHPGVLRLCRYMLGSHEEAEDAANEVFVRLPRALETYDTKQPFQPWLSRVASNYCVDLLRSRRSEQRILEPSDPDGPEPAAETISPLQELLWHEEREAVRAAIDRLPDQYRVPLVLRYYNELSYDQIGENMGLSRAHVATLIFRAKGELRRILTRISHWSRARIPGGAEVRHSCALNASS
jgi:RNA polymerase sigma-70 factor, ECF subfamily